MSRWMQDDVPDLSGRTALVTGANSGLGLEVSRALARAGARVLMGCRDAGRAAAARDDVLTSAPGADVSVVPLDLASLASVHEAAQDVRSRVGALDVLVNNAGLMAPPLSRTQDGFEMQIGVNHLGHFALTGLLLPLLRKASGPRVVSVSSVAHRAGVVNLADLSWEHRRYRAWQAYAASKLANLLFIVELDRRVTAADVDLVAAAAHPGFASTNLVTHVDIMRLPVLDRVGQAFTKVVGTPAAVGALPVLYAATMPEVRGNDYWGPGGPFGRGGSPVRAPRAASAYDAVTAAHLWERSEELTGVAYDL